MKRRNSIVLSLLLLATCASAQMQKEVAKSTKTGNSLFDGWKIDTRIISMTDTFTGKNSIEDFSELYLLMKLNKKLTDNISFNVGVDYRDYWNFSAEGSGEGELFNIDSGFVQFLESDFAFRQINFDYKDDNWYVVAGSRVGKEDLINNDAQTSTGLSVQYTIAKDLYLKGIAYSSISSSNAYEAYSRSHYTHGRSLFGASLAYKNKNTWYEGAFFTVGNDGAFDNKHNAGPLQNFTKLSDETFDNNPFGYYAHLAKSFDNGFKIEGQYFSLDWDLENSTDTLGAANGVDVFTRSYNDNNEVQTKAVIHLTQKTKYGSYSAGFARNGDGGGVVSFTGGKGTYTTNENNIIIASLKSSVANYRAATTSTWGRVLTPILFTSPIGESFVNARYVKYDTDLEQLRANGNYIPKDIENSEVVTALVTKVKKGLFLILAYSNIEYDKNTITAGTNDTQHVYRVTFDYSF